MAVTIAPATEAMRAIVARINSGDAYELPVRAIYSEQLIDPLEELTELRVDVVTESEETLNETLAVEDRTSLEIRIWIRKKVASAGSDEIDQLRLLVRQIFQRINNFDSSDGRVKIWECDYDTKEIPDKSILNQSWLFVSAIVLRVEVEAS